MKSALVLIQEYRYETHCICTFVQLANKTFKTPTSGEMDFSPMSYLFPILCEQADCERTVVGEESWCVKCDRLLCRQHFDEAEHDCRYWHLRVSARSACRVHSGREQHVANDRQITTGLYCELGRPDLADCVVNARKYQRVHGLIGNRQLVSDDVRC